MRYLDERSIEYIALGASFLGSGGGGNSYYAKLLALDNIRKNGQIKVIDVDELDENDLIISISGIGAPCVGLEKVENSFEFINAFKELETQSSHKY